MCPSSPATIAGASRSGLRMVAITVFPRSASLRAAAPPKPREAPVMRTTSSLAIAGTSATQNSGSGAGAGTERAALLA